MSGPTEPIEKDESLSSGGDQSDPSHGASASWGPGSVVVVHADQGSSAADPSAEGAAEAHQPADDASSTGATRMIALMNQKGGVGKTTTTVNLGVGLARLGKRVLLIDLDPQGHLTLHLGLDPDQLDLSVYDLLTDPGITAGEVVYEARENLMVLPAEVNLAGVESELASAATHGQGQRLLSEKCQPLLADGQWFDFVLIDCPPSLGLLTINALALAQEVFVPMQAHFLALQGLSKLLETVDLIKQSVNPFLVVSGIVLCMHESQTVLANEVLADLRAFLESARDHEVPWRDAEVLWPPIRRNIKLAECPGFGQAIFDYAPSCAGAEDYLALAESVAAQRSVRR